MNEFQQQDYGSARMAADNIKVSADKIMDVFDSVDRNMKLLYGDAWQSTGADATNGRYQEIRKNYEVFYAKVIEMHNYVHNATNLYEQSDVKVSQSISDI